MSYSYTFEREWPNTGWLFFINDRLCSSIVKAQALAAIHSQNYTADTRTWNIIKLFYLKAIFRFLSSTII